MKKTVAIVCNDIDVGGVETALINMLRAIDLTRFDITLFTNTEKNACISQIPKEVQIVSLEQFTMKNLFLDEFRNCKLISAASTLFDYIRLRLTKSEFKKVQIAYGKKLLSEKYFDCAIAYKHTVAMVAVLCGLHARKKVVWVHGALLGGDFPEQEYLNSISEFDKIYCVSEAVKNNVLKHIPLAADRVQVFYNLINAEEIRKKAEDECNMQIEPGEYCLVTVGRLGYQKGQEMIPETVHMLTEAGYRVKWYLVGDGPNRRQIENLCEAFQVTEQVIFAGMESNPYPYIKKCDLYVQTSFSEGFCTTTMEAKLLHKAVVTTDAPGMREQFRNRQNGLIVDAMTPEALFTGIKTLFEKPELCGKFEEELKKETHGNSRELEKLYAVMKK